MSAAVAGAANALRPPFSRSRAGGNRTTPRGAAGAQLPARAALRVCEFVGILRRFTRRRREWLIPLNRKLSLGRRRWRP